MPDQRRATTNTPFPSSRSWIDFRSTLDMMRATLLLVAFSLPASAAGDELPPPASHLIDFTRDVQPIFAKNCYGCHGEKRQKAGLRLDQRPDAMLPKIVTAGKSGDSRLIQLVAGMDPNLQMPPAGPVLSREQVGILRG